MSKSRTEKEGYVEIVHMDEPVTLYPAAGRGPGESWTTFILKAATPRESNVDLPEGRKTRPFNMDATIDFKNFNAHHANCIETKKEALVGLGMKNDKIETRLDRYCTVSWQEVISAIGEDYYSNANGYLEVVRLKKSGTITGLHHVPANTVFIELEDDQKNFHYELVGSNGSRHFARFGDYRRFSRQYKQYAADGVTYSEIIHFKQPGSLSRWYGVPSWLAATAAIELVQCMHQFSYDFYLNRGVPEFLLFLLGKQIDKPAWDKLTSALQNGIGLGNSHKSLALNIPDEAVTVQLEKLAVENGDRSFADRMTNLALEIVTAHRVPPALANIQIPGKLGAANELPNAILSFQTLVIGPAQHLFQTTLANTIGKALQLRRKDFAFNTITDEMSKHFQQTKPVDTLSRMRQTPLQGRNPKDGLLNDAEKRTTQRNQVNGAD
jgi:hypothetical protein